MKTFFATSFLLALLLLAPILIPLLIAVVVLAHIAVGGVIYGSWVVYGVMMLFRACGKGMRFRPAKAKQLLQVSPRPD